jgi:alkaline phosphatase D
LLVGYDCNRSFSNPIRVSGPFALETTDYTARVELTGLPEAREIFVQVMFDDLSNARNLSDPVEGHFRTAPEKNRPIRFLWSGDKFTRRAARADTLSPEPVRTG